MKLKQRVFGRMMAVGLGLWAVCSGGWVERAEGAAYIKFDGVAGEATDAEHDKWIDLLSVGFELKSSVLHQPGGGSTGQARTRGATTKGDVVVTKEMDKATPKLMEAVCGGGPAGVMIPLLQFDLVFTGAGSDGTARTTYYRYELTNVLVTSYSVSGSASGDPLPTEQITLNYEEIKVTYTKQDGSGAVVDGPVVGVCGPPPAAD